MSSSSCEADPGCSGLQLLGLERLVLADAELCAGTPRPPPELLSGGTDLSFPDPPRPGLQISGCSCGYHRIESFSERVLREETSCDPLLDQRQNARLALPA